MKKLITYILTAVAMSMPSEAWATIYTAVHDVDTYEYGFEKKESFDVAIHLSDPNLVGAKITAIRVPIVNEANVTSAGYTAWLSKELKVKANVFTPDALSATAEVSDGWATATLDEPYTITEDGVYAGYSFSIAAVTTEADKCPLVLANNQYGANDMWLHTSHTYRSWQDFGTTVSTSSPIQVVIDDASLNANAASFAYVDMIYAEQGKGDSHALSIQNHGNTPITSIKYEYQIGEERLSGEATFDTPIGCGYFGESQETDVQLPKFSKCDVIYGSITITEVNGAANADKAPTTDLLINVVPFITHHRPMVEEYTGLWCGYCPTGYVGLKLLSEHIKDEVVIVSIHNDDPMEVLARDKYPYMIEGYPDLWFDRTGSTDPFFGENLNNMYGLDNMWRKHAQEIAPCDIAIEADFTDDSKTAVAVKATAKFMYANGAAPYRVGFYLTADDLHNERWLQTNYYSTGTQRLPVEMAEFTKGEMRVAGLHFDDVLVAYSDVKGIKGSLPVHIESGEGYDVDYTFDIKSNKVIQDKSKLKAIAYVINTETGLIENANSVHVGADNAGLNDNALTTSTVTAVEYYDLNGIRIPQPQKGISIKLTRYSDGTHAASKIYR